MEWVEVTGKSIAEAKDRALDKLQVDEGDAEFEILEEPRTGLFGRVKGEARVRARVKPAAPRAKVEPRDRRRRSSRDKAAKDTDKPRSPGKERAPKAPSPAAEPDVVASPAPAVASAAPVATAPPAEGGRRRPPRRTPGSDAPVTSQPEAAVAEHAAPVVEAVDEAGDDAYSDETASTGTGAAGEGSTGQARRRRSRRGRGGRGEGNQGQVARADDAAGESEDDMGEGFGRGDHEPVGIDVAAGHTATFVEGLVGAFGYTGSVAWQGIDDETAEVTVEGESLGLLIGPKGRTLAAITEVARIAMLRAEPGAASSRVHVDVSGYRQRRREALTRFALQVAAEVVESGEPRALEPMSAADRKLVHDAVNDVDGVRTTSEGDDPHRRVVIHPAGGE